jgi:nucleoside-diphosphate-sugar epimerase
MKIAITGGTGFVGRHLARSLVAAGHEVVLVARGVDRRDPDISKLAHATLFVSDLSNPTDLAQAFAGCDAVAHCAGINREWKEQTYERVHVAGTRHVVAAARAAGVKRIALLSFLRARPNCGSPYHESKFAAEEVVRQSGLNFAIIKAGVIYGRGDHMLDHLCHALSTFPAFGLVGLKDTFMRPLAVEDLVRVLAAFLVGGRLCGETIAVTGPETISLREAVARVAACIGRKPVVVPLPILLHKGLAAILERVMRIPLVSAAQVRILSEGLVEPSGNCARVPDDLLPTTRFDSDSIRRGLAEAGRFRMSDLRCCA